MPRFSAIRFVRLSRSGTVTVPTGNGLLNVPQIADFRPVSGISTVWPVALWRLAARISPAITKNGREQSWLSPERDTPNGMGGDQLIGEGRWSATPPEPLPRDHHRRSSCLI